MAHKHWIVVVVFTLGLLTVMATGTYTVLTRWSAPMAAAVHLNNSASVPASTAAAIACIGSVEPERGVIAVAAPAISGKMPILARLLVNEGDTVKKGQPLAQLDAAAEMRASASQAETRVLVAQRRLDQAKAGARPADIRAAELQIQRLEHELNTARAELARKQALADKDLVPRVQIESARLKVDQAIQLLEEARLHLKALNEVRDADIALVEAQLRAAEADRDRAKVELASTIVRAPESGRIIRITTQPGEAVGPSGLLELAPSGRMVVLAEVYETDATRVKAGQRASITADALSKPVTGTVVWISPQIEQRPSPSLDPALFSESRIFKARITVDDNAVLADRIHARVNVRIEP